MGTLLFTGINSCSDDFLNLKPLTNTLDANSYVTEQDALHALASAYKALSASNGLEAAPINSDIFSDDAFAAGEPGGGMKEVWQPIEEGIAPIPTEVRLWQKFWRGVYRANTYLGKEGDIQWTTPGLRDQMKGEALTLRAYFYWDLERFFGWVPILDGVPADVASISTISQNSPDEVYKFIAKDLLTALPLLQDRVNSSTQKGHITRDVARVLMSRIYLYYQNFVKPVIGGVGGYTISSEWSDGSGQDGHTIDKAYVQNLMETIISSGRYHLLANYADIFSWENQNNEESIFEWQYSAYQQSTSDDQNEGGNESVQLYGIRDPNGDPKITSGWSFATVTFTLYNEFEAGDSRKNASIYDANDSLISYTKGFQNTGYFNYKYMPLTKYLQSAANYNWPDNYRDMRYAEVLLTASELFLQDDKAKALGYLNQVRTRAMGSAAALTIDQLDIEAITHERRVEFSGEGQRKWYLLERGLDYAQEKIDASFNTDLMPDYVSKSDFAGRQFNRDTWGMMPIPEVEIQLNPKLKQFVPAYQ